MNYNKLNQNIKYLELPVICNNGNLDDSFIDFSDILHNIHLDMQIGNSYVLLILYNGSLLTINYDVIQPILFTKTEENINTLEILDLLVFITSYIKSSDNFMDIRQEFLYNFNKGNYGYSSRIIIGYSLNTFKMYT